jgi:integrase
VPERLTDRVIAALKPSSKSVYVYDTEVVGLACRLYPSGRRAFTFEWREGGRVRRKTLGRFPAWSIGKARERARRLRLRADLGESIAPQRGGRVEDLAEQWREVVDLTRRPSTAKSYRRLLDKQILPRFGKLEPRAITRNAIEQWHGEIAARTPIEANRALGVLSAFCSWLEHDRLIERNLCRGIRRCPENQRHVFLDADEIAAAHTALDADHDRCAALALRLALLTGCRIGEALNLTAEQVDFKHALWVKAAGTTKQRRVHVVPLQRDALPVIRESLRLGPPDYDDCRRAWDRVKAALGRVNLRINDLRHSRASALARNGASLPQIGRVLGHSAPATTARYAHLVDKDVVDLVERS